MSIATLHAGGHVASAFAPIRVEKRNVLDELFALLPPPVAVVVMRRREPESKEFARQVEDSPNKFAPELLDEIKKIREREIEFPDPDPEEIRERRIREALNREAALLDAVLDLRREVGALREEVGALREAVAKTARRGFW
jgi:hypothetical protein